ncbi:major capsid protein [Sigmofec virus UA08Rod_4774]|uniref:Major capsid protein n=1 Tax=Sigmofec virus UA08Rod_4774 TaxID=2929409 RepID=A0A976N1P1_9VIRU|nr:major capsid protein [Sigmofec virus UA08Rod_4774]
MAIEKTIGGDQIGAGKKMRTELEGYSRSNFDLSRIFRTSAAPGTLIPCFNEIAQRGDTWNFNISSLIRTIPTRGPLFGTFTFDIHFFVCPIRLHVGAFHNDAVDLGNNMQDVLYPTIDVPVKQGGYNAQEIQWQSMDQSALLAYLGIRNPGHYYGSLKWVTRRFNALQVLNYFEIFKRYYSNKQEDKAYYIGDQQNANGPYNIDSHLANSTNRVSIYNNPDYPVYQNNGYKQIVFNKTIWIGQNTNYDLVIQYKTGRANWTKKDVFDWAKPGINGAGIIDQMGVRRITTTSGTTGPAVISWWPAMNNASQAGGYPTISIAENVGDQGVVIDGDTVSIFLKIRIESVNAAIVDFLGVNNFTAPASDYFTTGPLGAKDAIKLEMITIKPLPAGGTIALYPFPLKNIDEARWKVLKNCLPGEYVQIKRTGWTGTNNAEKPKTIDFLPYSALCDVAADGTPANAHSQNGLLVKTYNNDIYQNWLNTETIDAINQESGAAVVNGSIQIGNFILAEKIYKQRNKIAVSGGTYEDWAEAVYGISAERMCESPIFIGGARAKITFDEVVSTSETSNSDGSINPLGTLGGRGNLMPNSWKGGQFEVKITEDSLILGIMSITPDIDYSQGNWWGNTLQNNDQLHKPELDQIGFQQLLSDGFAGFDTKVTTETTSPVWGERKAYAMQPAWINYMTAVNQAFGDFANEKKAMFMTLNRRYAMSFKTDGSYDKIKDFTAYIDPTKFNYAFADATIESQNFWVQIAIDAKARRKMSSRIMPNL